MTSSIMTHQKNDPYYPSSIHMHTSNTTCFLCGNGRHCTGQLFAKALLTQNTDAAHQVSNYCYQRRTWNAIKLKWHKFQQRPTPQHLPLWNEYIFLGNLTSGTVQLDGRYHRTCLILCLWMIQHPVDRSTSTICRCQHIRQHIQHLITLDTPINDIISIAYEPTPTQDPDPDPDPESNEHIFDLDEL